MTLRYKEGKSTDMTKKYQLAKAELGSCPSIASLLCGTIIKRNSRINRRLDNCSQLASYKINAEKAAWEANI